MHLHAINNISSGNYARKKDHEAEVVRTKYFAFRLKCAKHHKYAISFSGIGSLSYHVHTAMNTSRGNSRHARVQGQVQAQAQT